ncbi:MAG TPA: VWA domain-containing protein [Pyrinomonadaceae bacterium]|nr:VWA domain-containing protein [Pyrinomonadaceae bacterium]
MSKSSRTICAFVLSFNLILATVPAQQKPAEEKIDVVRINTELVQTHVTVLDKKGNFVTGLRPDQFQVQVDGKAQNISFFEEVTAGGQLDRPLAPTVPSTGEKSPTAPTQPVVQRRTVFFFVDDMHLSPDSMVRTQDSLRRFVTETMGNSDQVAITATSAQLGFLQQLTNDKTVLRQAIERLKPRKVDYTDMARPPMTEYQAYAIEQGHSDVKELFIERTCSEVLQVGQRACSGAGMSNNAVLDEVNTRSDRGGSSGGGGSTGSNRTSPSARATNNEFRWRAENIVKSRARGITRQSAQGILATLSSLESLIRTAAQLPERKLVVFVSDGFFINFVSSTQVYDLKRITDFATRYGTVIYTIDARGLNSGLTDASKTGFFDPSGRMARVDLQEIRASQQSLFNLAAETGGEAWLNSNDMNAGITQAFSATSRYYLLAWRPEIQGTDSFRKVKVTVKGQPDLVVRVAGGFFSKAPEAKTNSAGVALSVDDQLLAALRASYPQAEVPVIVSAGYLSSANEGLVVAATIQIAAEAEVDLMGAVADDKGTILTTLKQQLTPPAGTGNDSLITTLQFPKLPTGLIQVRIAARDSKSGRIGSAVQWVELPNLSQNKFAVSSLFLSEGVAATQGTQGTAPKWIIKPDRRFARTGKLKFQVFVYNADQSAGAPVVHLQLELRREGQVLVQTPPGPIDMKGVTDLGRLPVVGEFPLADFPPGRYELKLIFTDQKTKSSASREAEFTIL